MADNPLPLLMVGGDGSFVAANKDLAALTSQGEKGKRVLYHCYDAILCTKVAKYICENGNKSTIDKFLLQLGSIMYSETTVRNFKYTYMYLSKLKLATIQMPSLIYLMPLLANHYLLVNLMIKCLSTLNSFVLKEALS